MTVAQADQARKNAIRNLLWKSTFGLDDMVHDLKAEEAAHINNQGKLAQVSFIMDVTEREVEDVAKEFNISLNEEM